VKYLALNRFKFKKLDFNRGLRPGYSSSQHGQAVIAEGANAANAVFHYPTAIT